MVQEANTYIRGGLAPRKKGVILLLLRIVALLAPLFVGVLYDQVTSKEPLLMFIFVILIAVSIIAVTISYIKE